MSSVKFDFPATASLSATSFGYKLGVFGVVLTLIWIGIFKFTPFEAAAIEPLIRNHFLMGWLYNYLSVLTVSKIVGISEIIVAIGLVYGFINPKVGFISGLLACGIFIMTLSFLFTTPGVWKTVEGVLVTEFFLVKDILFLAISIMVVEHNKKLL